MILLLVNHYYGDQMKEDEMVGHVARMAKKQMHKSFWLENLKCRNSLEDLGLRLRIIKTDLYGCKNRGCGIDLSGSG
jgi:hypothetical protein